MSYNQRIFLLFQHIWLTLTQMKVNLAYRQVTCSNVMRNLVQDEKESDTDNLTRHTKHFVSHIFKESSPFSMTITVILCHLCRPGDVYHWFSTINLLNTNQQVEVSVFGSIHPYRPSLNNNLSSENTATWLAKNHVGVRFFPQSTAPDLRRTCRMAETHDFVDSTHTVFYAKTWKQSWV